MGRYVLKRCISMIFVIIGAAFVIFTILYFTPGDPAEVFLGTTATAEELDHWREIHGLNDTYIVQLGKFLWSAIRLDFGESWSFSVPVWSGLVERLPRTLTIGIGAMLLQVLIGVPLGIFAATHEGRWQDSFVMVIAMILISCPSFWVALMLVVLFSVKLGILPASGFDSWQCYILPIVCSSLNGIAHNARQTRSSMLEVIRADFITTARAKGQKENVVIFKHMFPNALMPVITQVGSGLALIVSGSAVIESVFSIPGVGMYMLTGVNKRDYPIVRCTVLFLALFTALAMLLVDLAYAYVDPRIKAQYSKGKKV
ncbi:MAG: ABC transporter permease [Clostridiales bacterium]|nr:ABC transporter permease [Clostridiales bacterium]